MYLIGDIWCALNPAGVSVYLSLWRSRSLLDSCTWSCNVIVFALSLSLSHTHKTVHGCHVRRTHFLLRYRITNMFVANLSFSNLQIRLRSTHCQEFAAEFLGTMYLVMAVALSVNGNGGALAIGLQLMIMICSSDTSGAHFNPLYSCCSCER